MRGRQALHPAVSALVDVLRGEPAADRLRERPVEEVVAVADAHRVAPAVARALAGGPDAPDGLAAALRPWRTDQIVRHLSTLADLGPLATAFDGAGIRWAVVKGPVAAAVLWPAPDMRDYLDLDVIVEPARFADAIDVLHALGAEQLDRNWSLVRRQHRAELSFVLPHGTLLDLHWHPVNDARLRRRLRWPVGPMLERRRTVSVGSLTLPTLDPVDTALHMAYHATHSGAYRLLWLKDVELAVAAVDDPVELVSRAEAARLDVLVRVVLDRVALVLGQEDVRALPWRSRRAAGWRALLRAIDARTEVPRPGLGERSRRTLHTSTRTTTLGSLGVLLAEGVGHVVQRRDTRGESDNPLHVPDGDEAARRAYLRRVGTEA